MKLRDADKDYDNENENDDGDGNVDGWTGTGQRVQEQQHVICQWGVANGHTE